MTKRTPDPRRRVGRRGERWAALYLRGRGYRILARNHRTPVAEVDLVAAKGNELILVEVKSGRRWREQPVSLSQRRRLIQTAEWLHARWGRGDSTVRIDVIEIRWPAARCRFPRIRHWIDAIQGEDGD